MAKNSKKGWAFGLEPRRPAYVVTVYSAIGFLVLGFFGMLHVFMEGAMLVGHVEVAAAFALALNVLGMYLHKDRNAASARFVFLITVLCVLFLMLITGGAEGTGVFWFFIFPVGAFFLGGKKEGLWWMAALVAMVLAAIWLKSQEVLDIPYSYIDIRQLLASVLVVAAGIYVYQKSRESLETQTHRSREALHAQKLQADIILENIDEAVAATDAEGRITLINKAAEQMLGWKLEELVGKQYLERVPLIDERGSVIDPEKRPLAMTLKQNVAFSGELQCKRRDGSIFPVAVSNIPVTIDGKAQGAICTLRDITEQKAIDRAKSEFVTLASHQLRTPISSIGWVSEMLLHGDAGELKPEQHDYVEQLYTSNQRSAAIVDAMLMVSTLEMGDLRVNPEPTDLATLARQVLHEQVSKLRPENDLAVSESYDPHVPTLQLDPQLTKTMLSNLISNALKYTPKGGKVKISIGRNDHKFSPDSAGSVIIVVSDDGYGIPKRQQHSVFAKLFRATNIKEKDTDGTGLGLYIVKMILNQVGGQISLESEENKGSTFTIWLPLEGMRRKTKDTLSEVAQGGVHV